MLDNTVIFHNFFVEAYIFFIMNTNKKVNPYNIKMQALILTVLIISNLLTV